MGPKKTEEEPIECVDCGKKFKSGGWHPKFDKKYGLCEDCLVEIFMDYK